MSGLVLSSCTLSSSSGEASVAPAITLPFATANAGGSGCFGNPIGGLGGGGTGGAFCSRSVGACSDSMTVSNAPTDAEAAEAAVFSAMGDGAAGDAAMFVGGGGGGGASAEVLRVRLGRLLPEPRRIPLPFVPFVPKRPGSVALMGSCGLPTSASGPSIAVRRISTARAESGSPSLCFRSPCTPLPLASAAPSKCCPFPDNLRARARPAPGPPTSTESGRDMLCLSCPVMMLGGSDEFGVCRRLVEDLSLPHNMHTSSYR